MKIDVLTLFPEMFKVPLGESIIGKATDKQLLEINLLNIRDYATNKHKKVDDYPYGGGGGMIMQPQPIVDALESLAIEENTKIIYMSPKGKVFNQKMAQELSKEKRLVILCGHYEGVDQRVIDEWVTDEISIGDYVLTGGELPAMVLIDSVSRMIAGVLGKEDGYKDESIYSGLLEYPQYSRPSDFRGYKVPEVLLSGNHKEIKKWRMLESLKITYDRRKDLLNQFLKDLTVFDKQEKKIIEEFLKDNKKKL